MGGKSVPALAKKYETSFFLRAKSTASAPVFGGV
jgi:hypothetical protein